MIAAIAPVYQESPELVQSLIENLLSYEHISQIILAATRQDPGLADVKSLIQHSDHQDRVAIAICESSGRAAQMNHGANTSDADILLFVHCDTRLPVGADKLVIDSLKKCQWGRFDVQLDDQKLIFKIISWFINKRSRLTGISTGDQALFMKRELFQQLRGFPNLALMEDIEFSKQAKKMGPPAFISAPVITSARRWQQGGVVKTILLMWWLRASYWFGVEPDRLAQIYRQVR